MSFITLVVIGVSCILQGFGGVVGIFKTILFIISAILTVVSSYLFGYYIWLLRLFDRCGCFVNAYDNYEDVDSYLAYIGAGLLTKYYVWDKMARYSSIEIYYVKGGNGTNHVLPLGVKNKE